MPRDPEWGTVFDGSSWNGHIAGVEYENNVVNNIFDESNAGDVVLADQPAPCAVCCVGREAVLMIPSSSSSSLFA